MPAKNNQPTAMQAKAMELIREGKTPTQAMREAGYSEDTTEAPKQNLLSRPGVISIIEQYRDEYARVGITQQYMAAKTAQWLEAKKVVSARITGKDANGQTDDFIEVDDYQTQLKAAEMVRKDWGLGQPDVTLNQQNNFFLSDEQLQRILGEDSA